MAARLITRLAEWASAGRALPGESTSGDIAVTVEHSDGVLLAAIDGLGHGPEASEAAMAAAEILEDSPQEKLDVLMTRAHERLLHSRDSRGVVMSIVSLRPEKSTWLGVGNVEGKMLRTGADPAATVYLSPLGGIVGHELPALHVSALEVRPGDVMVLATDGVREDFGLGWKMARPVQEIADSLLDGFARDNDDALVVVARYLGGG